MDGTAHRSPPDGGKTSMGIPSDPADSHSDTGLKSSGRIRFSILLTDRAKMENNKLRSGSGKTRGFIQISPAKEGPWTTVRLNYAAPAACWRFGNNVIVSEVNVLDSSRYVNIRSLVSLVNKTGFLMEFSLKSKPSVERIGPTDEREEEEQSAAHSDICETEELFQIEKHVSSIGWVGCSTQMPFYYESNGGFAEVNSQEMSTIMLPDGWEWTDDWHVDTSSVNSDDGWVYAPGPEHLKWPDSFSPANSPMHARQRRWIRHRKYIPAGLQNCMSLGQVKPGEAVPLPLQCLIHPTLSYYLQLRPTGSSDLTQYSWSKALSNFDNIENSTPEDFSDVCVSSLGESEELLFCEPSGNSSDGLQSLWFRLSIKALDIGKDIHSDPIHDWNLVIDSPLSFTYFLPITADYSVLRKEPNGHFVTCSRGRFNPGETVEVYDVDLREGLYLSLVPQGGWEPLHEPALISHPSRKPSKTMSLRSCFSGRIVQVILEQNHEGNQMQSRLIRIYVPYWISSTRCPPLIYRIVDVSERRERTRFAFRSRQQDEKVILQITQDEMLEGDTISAALNFKHLGMSLSLGRPGKENFGPVKELLPLGDMDGSMDLYAYDTEGNCIRVLISSKPCRYQAVPTKVISVRPFMTFTNRIGQDIFIKFGDEDQQKVLHPSDSRVSFVYSGTEGSERLQVRMEDTNWSYPVEILKEDKITLMLRDSNGERKFLRLEIRGYEEGSRFLIVLRPGSAHGPIRVENRIANMKINIRQSSLGDDAWIPIHPLSSINFSWEVPYGPNLLDICIKNGHTIYAQNISLEKATESCANLNTQGFELHVLEVGDVKIARVTDIKKGIKQQSEEQHRMLPISNRENLSIREEMGNTAAPMELIVELSVVSVSLVDHRPRELLYLYLEKVFISYASGYDGGTTSRFKLIMGQLQLDNQLPLTVMPVLLMPERMGDTCHPVFKTTITMSNENIDGIQVYPYVYVRVTENYWRINIHEPIIWALIDFYNNLHIDHVPNTSSVTQVDPEIRIDLIDVSEIRLKVSLETAPSQRPHGVLGIWSPILSAVGNALKIQVRLRKVMHRSRFMRKSFIIPAIMNRIKRDLIHNPLHIILSVDVLGMTKSTFASLSKGFAELSTDVQFLQLRSKQVWSRRITGVSDGILQGTEALAQGVAFGVSGVITKPVESARERGVLGLPHGVGRAIIGFIVQPVSGALDFVSLTVDGIGASCARCLELLSNKSAPQRIRNPRVVHANGLLKEYSEREATGQMILYLAEASRHLGCTNLFKEPSKYAWSDCYEDYFILPNQRILLITNKRVMLLLCLAPDKMDRKPSKIIWDVPWEEIMALELAKAGYPKPSHLIIHLKSFKKSESFVRLVKCSVEEEDDQEPQAVRICLVVRQTWKSHQLDMKSVTLRVPERQRYVQFAWDETDGGDSDVRSKPIIRPRELTSSGATPGRFAMHSVNFQKIWSSERDSSSRCTFCPKQVVDDNVICSIWRPVCPDGYVPVGDVARVGIHPPNVAAVYRHSDRKFTHPVGYDLVWRNCIEDYVTPVSIWSPRPPEGFISLGCVAVAGFEEPHPDTVYCVSTNIAGEALFEDQVMWTAPDSYPWACFIYQVQSEALHFVAMRQPKEDSNWKPMRVLEHEPEESRKNQR
ncbi:hypothetical protein Taro_008256 [Colocasia esculenta]|uniref:Peroxin/Ferlin domain-containing protein n=1 Tax=Colocasia esculenta TaxID=4460 RepID=A0A843U1E3_COLES|nr:hypothetical protein [Colocasia esculenta]